HERPLSQTILEPAVDGASGQVKQSQALTMQEPYWSLATEQLLAALHTTNSGLQQTDAESRIKQYGHNALKAPTASHGVRAAVAPVQKPARLDPGGGGVHNF